MALNVLMVDDSATVRAIIGKALRLGGVDVRELHEAANGAEALEILKTHWVDLVLSDLNMPVMDGAALIEKMAQDELLKSIPVIIVSTEGSATRIEDLKAKGVTGFIRKPFAPEDIRAMVDQIMGGA